jgi:hypothetical protein
MICTEIHDVRPFPVSACEGIITTFYVPADTDPETALIQLQDRHGNQCLINPISVTATSPNYTVEFSLADAPENFMSQTGVYLLRILNSVYCFNGIVPNVCGDADADSYETVKFWFSTPQIESNEWTIID